MSSAPADPRRWRLPRGRHGLPRELIARSQRERLLAAVVRVTATKGYERMSVADILSAAGVGRQTFYELFSDKRDCLLAAHEALVDQLESQVREIFERSGPWPRRVRDALAAVLHWFAANPDAARVTLIELGPIGPIARERFLVTFHRFTALLDEGREGSEAAETLPNITSLAAATALARIFEEIASGRTEQLPDLLPELTFEMLIPFVGEEMAREAATG